MFRLEAMERARNRMQELYDQRAEEWAIRQQALEDKKWAIHQFLDIFSDVVPYRTAQGILVPVPVTGTSKQVARLVVN